MEHNSCADCKYEGDNITCNPCFSCIRGLCNENPNRTDKFEEKVSSEVFNNEKDNL